MNLAALDGDDAAEFASLEIERHRDHVPGPGAARSNLRHVAAIEATVTVAALARCVDVQRVAARENAKGDRCGPRRGDDDAPKIVSGPGAILDLGEAAVD